MKLKPTLLSLLNLPIVLYNSISAPLRSKSDFQLGIYEINIPGSNLDTEMSIEFSVAFYSSTLHIYYLSLYWPDLKS